MRSNLPFCLAVSLAACGAEEPKKRDPLEELTFESRYDQPILGKNGKEIPAFTFHETNGETGDSGLPDVTLKTPRELDDTTPESVVEKVKITIVSNPSGKIIDLKDGGIIGTTEEPFELDKSSDAFQCVIRAHGYQDYPLDIIPIKDKLFEVKMIPQKKVSKPPKPGPPPKPSPKPPETPPETPEEPEEPELPPQQGPPPPPPQQVEDHEKKFDDFRRDADEIKKLLEQRKKKK